MNIVQNTEIWKLPTHQYLSIHKNASSYITECLLKKYDESEISFEYIAGNNPSELLAWTVVRDPLNRFINALSYDINKVGLQVTQNTINEVIGTTDKLCNYIFGKAPIRFRNSGKIRHSMLQTSYLFDNRIDIIVGIEDLDIFVKMHFPGIFIDPEDMNLGNKTLQNEVQNYLNNNPKTFETLNTLLAIDYFTLENFKAADSKWHWANGTIF